MLTTGTVRWIAWRPARIGYPCCWSEKRSYMPLPTDALTLFICSVASYTEFFIMWENLYTDFS